MCRKLKMLIKQVVKTALEKSSVVSSGYRSLDVKNTAVFCRRFINALAKCQARGWGDRVPVVNFCACDCAVCREMSD
jgi:hypothetical protein